MRPTTDWVAEGRSAAVADTSLSLVSILILRVGDLCDTDDNLVKAKLRRRLSAKYHSETCILATRQLTALRSPGRGMDTRKARWLKRNCR